MTASNSKDEKMDDRSLWRRILDVLEAGTLAMHRTVERREGIDSVAFSIAFIALAAKLAKADGTVTRDEVTMFRRIFEIPTDEEANAARVYNLCRQDATGYKVYAQQMHKSLGAPDPECETRSTVLDGLFHIAMADGEYHPNEQAFLRAVAEVFELDERVFVRLQAQHVPGHRDPWLVLGVKPGADADVVARARRDFLRINHPDHLMARGLPAEMVALADSRLAAFNAAYDEIKSLEQWRHSA